MTGRGAPSVLDEAAVEQVLTGRAGAADLDLQQIVATLGSMADGPPPPPSAALADLLDHGVEPTVVPLRRPAAHPRRWAARTGAGLVAAAASVVVAGTAAALPAPVQDTVADLVSALTPFELPRPVSPDEAPAPAPAPADEEAPSGGPTPSAPAVPSSTGPTSDDGPEEVHEDALVDERGGDRRDAERRERERQRAAEEAAEESQRAMEDAAEETAELPERDREDTGDVEDVED